MFIDAFQNIVMLIQKVFSDVLAYFSFLVSWVLIFAFVYQALGITIKDSDNQDNTIMEYLAGAWTLSTTGTSDELASSYWSTEISELAHYSNGMGYFIAFITWINQVYL
jgi:hypothetical protein